MPSNFLLKYFSPSKWLARIMFTFSVCAMCQAAATTYSGFLVCRALLGLSEAGFFPGCLYYFLFWYKPEEQAWRFAIFTASIALSGAFSGAIASGISFLNGVGGLYGWQFLFLIEGAPGESSPRLYAQMKYRSC